MFIHGFHGGRFMSMGKRNTERQEEFWIAATHLSGGPGHPFYQHLNSLLAEHGFDDYVQGRCEKFYVKGQGRPSIPPGVYFRMLMIGYFEGIDSERGIAWRCGDSLGLREFLGYSISESTPNHSSLSVIRGRIDIDTHREVFQWVLKVLARTGLLKGRTVGVDATTLEANAALRSIVRRDNGQGYEEFLTELAKASGIETPTREDLVRIDRKRPKKGSNADWMNPHNPEAKITKMKDGRTHLAHKAEHAVDLDSSAVLAVTLRPGDEGDTTSLFETLADMMDNLSEVRDDPSTDDVIDRDRTVEVTADKGYHSKDTLRELDECGFRSYVSEPKRRGRRHWTGKSAERDAVYGNRRRITSRRGKSLLRKRGEYVERSFAHCYDTGGIRRIHLKGCVSILKRLLVHVAGFNLGLVLRSMFGSGTPRGLAARAKSIMRWLWDLLVASIMLLKTQIGVQCLRRRQMNDYQAGWAA
jgi:transposase